MEFSIRHDAPDMLSSVHVFPGDQFLSSEDYATAIHNGYVSTVSTLYGAARSYGVSPDTETFERWKRLCAAAGILDDYLDESADRVRAHFMYMGHISLVLRSDTSQGQPWHEMGTPADAVRLLHASAAILPEKELGILARAAARIGQVALDKATTDDLPSYLDLLRQEAASSSLLIHGTASQEVQSQANYASFRTWCNNALLLGTLVDHARDLSQDYESGRTAVPPTRLNVLRIARAAWPAFSRLAGPADNRRASIHCIAARVGYSPRMTPTLIERKHFS